MEYRIVSSPTHSELSREVNRLMAYGWRPTGGLACEPGYKYYHQAMTRDKADA